MKKVTNKEIIRIVQDVIHRVDCEIINRFTKEAFSTSTNMPSKRTYLREFVCHSNYLQLLQEELPSKITLQLNKSNCLTYDIILYYLKLVLCTTGINESVLEFLDEVINYLEHTVYRPLRAVYIVTLDEENTVDESALIVGDKISCDVYDLRGECIYSDLRAEITAMDLKKDKYTLRYILEDLVHMICDLKRSQINIIY